MSISDLIELCVDVLGEKGEVNVFRFLDKVVQFEVPPFFFEGFELVDAIVSCIIQCASCGFRGVLD